MPKWFFAPGKKSHIGENKPPGPRGPDGLPRQPRTLPGRPQRGHQFGPEFMKTQGFIRVSVILGAPRGMDCQETQGFTRFYRFLDNSRSPGDTTETNSFPMILHRYLTPAKIPQHGAVAVPCLPAADECWEPMVCTRFLKVFC